MDRCCTDDINLLLKSFQSIFLLSSKVLYSTCFTSLAQIIIMNDFGFDKNLNCCDNDRNYEISVSPTASIQRAQHSSFKMT